MYCSRVEQKLNRAMTFLQCFSNILSTTFRFTAKMKSSLASFELGTNHLRQSVRRSSTPAPQVRTRATVFQIFCRVAVCRLQVDFQIECKHPCLKAQNAAGCKMLQHASFCLLTSSCKQIAVPAKPRWVLTLRVDNARRVEVCFFCQRFYAIPLYFGVLIFFSTTLSNYGQTSD